MEKCGRCGKEFANTKALGSHLHYVHESILEINLDLNAIRQNTLKQLEKEGAESAHLFIDSFIKAGAAAMANAVIQGLRVYLSLTLRRRK